MDFTDISCLQYGNAKQQKAYHTLTKYAVLENLSVYDPILVGTIPINIDIDSSDLDIICTMIDKDLYVSKVTDLFQHMPSFLCKAHKYNSNAIVTSFQLQDFTIEIYADAIPSKQQNAYRHMLAEHKLIQQKGEDFRLQIIELKKNGHKTEPAFGVLLGLKDPYNDLLLFE